MIISSSLTDGGWRNFFVPDRLSFGDLHKWGHMHASRLLFLIMIIHSVGISMGIVGCVMLYHGCRGQAIEWPLGPVRQTQIFDTNKSEHIPLTERVVWMWGPYQNWVDPLGEYSWWSILTQTVRGICTIWIIQQLSVWLLHLAWILGWRSGVILLLRVTIGSVGCNILTTVLLSASSDMVIH